jgi:superoxide dismutase, Fe-Mn family
MPLALPPLPYPYGAPEPTIDELTMRIHHDKHHGGYVAGVNAALEGTAWADRPVDELLGDLDALPEDTRRSVRDNGGGHLNHGLFWESMPPDHHGPPAGPLAGAIEGTFGSVRELKLQLSATGNQDSPLMRGNTPLLGVDVWEHAYYLRYEHRRADYLEAWGNVVDRQRVAARYTAATRRISGGDHE